MPQSKGIKVLILGRPLQLPPLQDAACNLWHGDFGMVGWFVSFETNIGVELISLGKALLMVSHSCTASDKGTRCRVSEEVLQL